MKNPGQTAMLAVAILFVGFLLGFLFGKITPDALVSLSAYDRTKIESHYGNANPDTYGKININQASADLLATLPGIGETIAQRIVDYREENGAFIRIQDLALVKGISNERVEAISDYITVGG